MKHGTHSISYTIQVLPVLLKGLPLKEDQEESMAVYSCIYSLVLASNPQVFFSTKTFQVLTGTFSFGA